MRKKRWILLTSLILILSSVYGFYNYKIIKGEYDSLTITKMGKTTAIINDIDEINKIIELINKSPRKFNPNRGFRYDYLPHGLLIFESENERFEIGFVIPKGNTLTKYWEIETNFEFGKDMD